MSEPDDVTGLMAILCAREIRPGDRFGIGVASPIPSLGARIALSLGARDAIPIGRNLPGGVPLAGSLDFTAMVLQGRVDLFFLSAAQIDATGAINLQYVGDGERRRAFFGAFAAPLYYPAVGRTVLFREEHSPRTFVERVDWVTATPPEAPRHDRPVVVVTPKAVLRFSSARGGFELESFHPGETIASVRDATGFDLPAAAEVHETPAPSAAERALLARFRAETASSPSDPGKA
ncbi:CoA synthetase [Pinisolibacter aquiterrae]|uniref:CoA synthetase n=1 Tax=Pinisolibacter aquiterrae TaxID=2815579 RepID=UPI001C3E1AFF|nr:CoA synthetase [Pinisolibacter aquiterrae]MBV5265425.1 CoA synthetase [Pinisolibacter aquiterrae]MCC8236058.1 CoA synthetase [Pinisolibacter aquiterrae]